MDLPQTEIVMAMKVPAVTQLAPAQENGWSQIILYSGQAGIWYRGLDLPSLLSMGKRVPDRFGTNVTVYDAIFSGFVVRFLPMSVQMMNLTRTDLALPQCGCSPVGPKLRGNDHGVLCKMWSKVE